MTNEENLDAIKTEIEKLKNFYGYDEKTNVGIVAKEIIDKMLNFVNSLQKEETVSNDLEDAANYYVKSTIVGSPFIKKNAFKTGAHWKEKQMMSKAIEAHVFGKEGGLPLYCFKSNNKDTICGQTVKIAILKEQ